jgi:hypothetical protein
MHLIKEMLIWRKESPLRHFLEEGGAMAKINREWHEVHKMPKDENEDENTVRYLGVDIEDACFLLHGLKNELGAVVHLQWMTASCSCLLVNRGWLGVDCRPAGFG